MRKPRVIARDVDRIAKKQAETVLVNRLIASVLTRGFWGRWRWLVFGT